MGHIVCECSRVVALALLASLLVACGGEPVARYSGILAASEFAVGPNRFPFGLVSRDGEFLEDARVTVRFYSLEEAEPGLVAEVPATWRAVKGVTPHEHPGGEVHLHLDFRGVYVVDEVTIPAPGIWVAEFDVVAGPGERPAVEGAAFQVVVEGSAPRLGERVPATKNRTLHDVASFVELSTRSAEDDMHNVSVAQALEQGEPFVVFFASPQFCVSAMCGPVTDTLAEASEQFRGRAEFIHIEPWDLDAARNEGRLVPATVMAEWGLPSEPWTFIVDGDGRVAKRFEGLVTTGEVVTALEPLL